MTDIDWNDVDGVELEEPTFRRAGDYRRLGRDGPPFVFDPTGDRTLDGKRIRSLLYGRPSGLHRWADNAIALDRWNERAVLRGTVLLVESGEIAAPSRDARLVFDEDLEADRLVARAKHVAGADLAAARGTAAHEATHRLHDAERAEVDVLKVLPELGFTPELVAAILEAYERALVRWDLEVLDSELRLVDDRWRVAGTADRFVRLRRDLRFGELVIPAGTIVVLDLKTGGLRVDAGEPLYWHGYAVQLRSYAQSVRYVIDGAHERREPLGYDVDQTVGLILHVDIAGALDTDVVTVSLWTVDLVFGDMLGELAVAARAAAKARGVFGQLAEGPIAQTVEVAGPSRLELELEESLRCRGVEPPERPLSGSESRDELRRWLQGRIDVIGAHERARADTGRRWPAGVPALRTSDTHTDAELEAIERALDRIETEHSIPFGPPRPGATVPPSGWLGRLLGTFPGTTIESTGLTQDTERS